jgi:citrate synthase
LDPTTRVIHVDRLVNVADNPPNRSRYLSASEAVGILGVAPASLYAYVSRGRIHAEADPRDPRRSRYLAADVERLRDRKQARLHPDAAARKSLNWGIPVLESALTLIDDGRLFYRGHDAMALASTGRFEDVVRLLWGGDADSHTPEAPTPPALRRALARVRSLPTMERLQAMLPLAAAGDPAAFDVRSEAVAVSGWRILRLLAAATTLQPIEKPSSIAAALAAGWQVRTRQGRRLLDMALILCADHELNVSAFAARVVASTGSSPYDVVGAGLAALKGPRHGGYTARVESFLDECGSPAGVRRAMADRLRRGEPVPGFGHPLYPDGDPRARLLLETVEKTWPDSKTTAYLRAGRTAGRALLGEYPTVDFALVVARRALALPRGSALVLFALGRTVGWVAHAMEQYAVDRVIRPRAAYTGPAPGPA